MTITLAKGAYDPPWCAPPKSRFGHTGKPSEGPRRCGARGTECGSKLEGASTGPSEVACRCPRSGSEALLLRAVQVAMAHSATLQNLLSSDGGTRQAVS